MSKRFNMVLLLTLLFAYPVFADSLGPASTNSSTSSIAPSLNILQPATPSLQSADSEGGGINQPSTTNNLQPAGSSSAASILDNGEVDGSPVAGSSNQASGTNRTSEILLAVIIALVVIASIVLTRIAKAMEQVDESEPKSSDHDGESEEDHENSEEASADDAPDVEADPDQSDDEDESDEFSSDDEPIDEDAAD